jgi:mono/diheme cytochrome c family protein
VKPFGFALAAALTVPLFTPTAFAAPVVPGLANKHPLTEPQVGQLLMGELLCSACHRQKDAVQSPERVAPDLADVGARVAPDFLRRFIASPSAAHAGTTMPDLLAGEPADRRDQIAEAITHFLVVRSPHKFERQPIGAPEAAAGKTLFHTVGCIACHAPRDDAGKQIAREGVVELAHLPAKYNLASLSEFLFQPTRARPSGRMPDMKLTPVEAKAIAGYLLGKADTKAASLQPQEKLIALGKEHFQRLNCAACHQLEGVPAAKPVGTLEGSDVTRGCLSDAPSKAPRFNLSADQTKAIRSALAKKADPPSDKERLGATLTAFNCIACHARDDYGGVAADVNELFRSSEKELGDEGRIPPPLTLVGAKLQKVALKKVLFDGDGVRPYMATRMPQFGEPNLRHLPDLFAGQDATKKIEFSLPKSEAETQKERDREKEMRTAGRELVGDQGLNCIACHSFNGHAPGKAGIEMLTFNERLQPSWFYHFVRDPNAYRPRTVMPTSWPGGQAVQKKILNGDTDRQIEAIWYYLSLGTSAQEPAGIRTPETLLSVTDATRTYRGRSSVAGYRGIAVGFPDRLNYAFNAETGTLTALWRGDFIKVNRSGQGSGGFNPAGKYVQLAQDLSFYDLADEKAAWPLRPVMTKEAPVNPDPLYPKNCGYQFKGYYMDDASIPTFMYRSGDIEIEDRSAAETADKKTRLVRKLMFDSPKDRTVWFRALTGRVETESKERFKTAELRLIIPPVATVLRPTSADPKSSELLLKIAIPKGKSTHTLTYEILP